MPGDNAFEEDVRAEYDDNDYARDGRNVLLNQAYGAQMPGSSNQDLEGAIPFDLGGASARAAAERAAWDKLQRQRMWAGLGVAAPDALDLTQRYVMEGDTDEYGNLIGDPSAMEGATGSAEYDAQARALRNLQEYGEQGGIRSGDRAAMQQGRLERGQWMRGQNDAAIQQAQARGMGGSGAELAMRLGSAQSANNANAMGDSAIMAQAQQRALQSMMAGGQMAQNAYGLEQQRRQALDDFNQQNMGWRRGRETRNTGTWNEQQDRIVGARQQAYGNQERVVAGYDQQYSTDAQTAQANAERQQESSDALGEAIGAIAVAACCHPETMISTPDGDEAISDLSVGDLVLTVHEGRVVARPLRAVQAIAVHDHVVQRVLLGNCETLEITPNHPTADGRGIGELVVGDYLGGVRIVATEPVPYEEAATFDILPDSDTGTYFAGGAHLGSTMRRQS